MAEQIVQNKGIQLKSPDRNINFYPKTTTSMVVDNNGISVKKILEQSVIRTDVNQQLVADYMLTLDQQKMALSNIQAVTYYRVLNNDGEITEDSNQLVKLESKLSGISNVLIHPKTIANNVAYDTKTEGYRSVGEALDTLKTRISTLESAFGDDQISSEKFEQILEVIGYISTNDIISLLPDMVTHNINQLEDDTLCKNVAVNTKGTYTEYVSTAVDDFGVRLYSRSKTKSAIIKDKEGIPTEVYDSTQVYPITKPNFVQWTKSNRLYKLDAYLENLENKISGGLYYEIFDEDL